MRNRPLDLKALQSFTTVLSAGSVTAAARQLNYSQSAVSMQLRRLEDELEITLFDRTHSRSPASWMINFYRDLFQ
jgi:DNA-binding transcriptional LysR family regulator